MRKLRWSTWRPLPDPRKSEILQAPIGPGCYELRRRSGKLVLCGRADKSYAVRMASLFPEPFGVGIRKNAAKREYVLKYVRTMEYRTRPCRDAVEAKRIERGLLRANEYRFPT